MRSRFAAGMLIAVFVSGCGPAWTDVSGKVSFRDRPVVTGTVTGIGSDQMTYYAPIELDGTFTFTKVPVGPVRFGVFSPDPYFEPPVSAEIKARIQEARRAAGEVDRPRPPRGKWMRLPAKYADPLCSGLTIEITAAQEPIHLILN